MNPDDHPLLRVNDLTISFVTRSGVIRAINAVSFEIKQKETLGLVGETGCGKSQTAMAILRLTPTAGVVERGEIWFEGQNFLDNIKREFRLIRRRGRVRLRRNKRELDRTNSRMSRIRGSEIAMVFQEPMTSLNPVYTIGRQVSEVLLTHKIVGLVDRILSSSAASVDYLKVIAEESTTSAAAADAHSPDALGATLARRGLEGLDEPIRSILRRKDIGRAQKIEAIERLHRDDIKPVSLSFLRKVKRSGGIPIEYRVLNRVPFLRRWFEGIIEREAQEVAYELLLQVKMPNARSVLSQHPHELSGGMRQRVMLAAAIAANPKLIIADEPTSALDVTVQAQILDLLRDLKDTYKTSVLFISHDLGVVSEICDRIGVMYAGNIVEIAPTAELFERPMHPYTQGLLAAIPKYGEKRDTLEAIQGSVPNLLDPPSGCRFRTRCSRAFEKCSQGPPWIEMGNGHTVLCWLYGDSERHIEQ